MSAIQWDVSPLILELPITDTFSLKLRWYGLLFALGFVVGYYIIEWIFKVEKKPVQELENLTMTMVLSTVFGARLGHCLFYNPGYYLSNPVEILKVWEGGLASHGAAIGILIGLWLFVRKRRKNFNYLWILDRLSIVIALAGSFIRLGNLFNSEILGKPADLPWSFVFVRLGEDFPRHPTQIYESLSYLLIFAFLFFLYNRQRENIRPGILFGLFLILVFGARLIIELFKENQVAFESLLPINLGQLLSIPLIIAGFYLLIFKKTKKT